MGLVQVTIVQYNKPQWSLGQSLRSITVSLKDQVTSCMT